MIYYNPIRAIESTFRILKTEVDLRLVYYKNDTATLAHLPIAIALVAGVFSRHSLLANMNFNQINQWI
jgi:hypothetical protein